jgi:hypothetical protein
VVAAGAEDRTAALGTVRPAERPEKSYGVAAEVELEGSGLVRPGPLVPQVIPRKTAQAVVVVARTAQAVMAAHPVVVAAAAVAGLQEL